MGQNILSKLLTNYCSIDNECKRFYNQNDNYKVDLVPERFGSHLQGGTRVMLHALHADTDNIRNIVYVQMTQTSL